LHIIYTAIIVHKISVYIYLLLCNHMVAYVVDKIHIGLPGLPLLVVEQVSLSGSYLFVGL